MLRLSVTKLREKGLNYLLPLDKHVSFHALTGKLIGVYSLIHTVAHLVNLGKYWSLQSYPYSIISTSSDFGTVKPLITNTSEEIIKCRLDNFSMSFILYYVNFSICETK